MAGLDAFFRSIPANEDAQFQTMRRIPQMLGAVQETDDFYRAERQRAELQQRLPTVKDNVAGLQPVGFTMPPSVFDVTNKPMPGDASTFRTPYVVREPAPVPVPAPASDGKVSTWKDATQPVNRVPEPAVAGSDQVPIDATTYLQNYEAQNGKFPAAIREKIYANAQGKGTSLTVPDFIPNGRSRVGEIDANIPGYTKVDPNLAGFNRNAATQNAQLAVNRARENIRNKLATGDYGLAGNVFGAIKGYFTDTAQEANKRAAITEALDWFNSKEAIDYFNQNPNALPIADIDPVGFVNAFKKEGAIRDSRRAATKTSSVVEQVVPIIEYIESRGNVNAVSPKGAQGAMQIMRATGKDPGFGVKPLQNNSPEENRRFGRDYFAAMLNRYDNNVYYALAAYNWGPGNVDNWIKKGSNPNALPTETKNYIAQYNQLAKTGVPQAAPQTTKQAAAAPSGKVIAIGDSLAEGFAKANKLDGSYKTGASPTAVLKMLKEYAAKNDLNGVTIYLGTGLPNNPAERTAVEQQIAFIKSKGGVPVIFGTGPGTQKNPTTGQNDFLSQLAQTNNVEFTGRLMDLYPSVAKDPMGLHLQPKQYQDLYGRRTARVQVDNTGRYVVRPDAQNVQVSPGVRQDQPAAEAPAQVAGVSKPAGDLESDEVLKRVRVALSMTPEQHNFETNKLLYQRNTAIQQYQQSRAAIEQFYKNELGLASQQRQQLAMEAEVARRNGLIKEAQSKLDQIRTLDGQINQSRLKYQQDMITTDQAIQKGLEGVDNNLGMSITYQALHDFQYANNPQRLERIWSWYSGQEIRIQPRTDGKFNLYMPVDGELRVANVLDKATLADMAMRTIDQSYRQRKQDAEAALYSKQFETQLETAKLVQVELVKGINSLKVESFKSQTELIKKAMEMQGFDSPQKVINPDGGESLVAFSKDGNYVARFDMNPAKMGTDGKFSAENITVLPTQMNRGLNVNRK
jgi:hypothetical protein